MGDFIHFIIQRQDIVQNLSSQISRLKIYIKNYLNIVENALILPSPKIPHVAKCANSPNLYATNIFQSLFFLITCACYYFLFPKEILYFVFCKEIPWKLWKMLFILRKMFEIFMLLVQSFMVSGECLKWND